MEVIVYSNISFLQLRQPFHNFVLKMTTKTFVNSPRISYLKEIPLLPIINCKFKED
jgi:hypothetical protein